MGNGENIQTSFWYLFTTYSVQPQNVCPLINWASPYGAFAGFCVKGKERRNAKYLVRTIICLFYVIYMYKKKKLEEQHLFDRQLPQTVSRDCTIDALQCFLIEFAWNLSHACQGNLHGHDGLMLARLVIQAPYFS